MIVGSFLSNVVPGQYVVITAPGTAPLQALQMVGQAEGALIGGGGFGNILFAASDDPDFAEALQRAGAWMVLPAPAFLGCAPDSLEN